MILKVDAAPETYTSITVQHLDEDGDEITKYVVTPASSKTVIFKVTDPETESLKIVVTYGEVSTEHVFVLTNLILEEALSPLSIELINLEPETTLLDGLTKVSDIQTITTLGMGVDEIQHNPEGSLLWMTGFTDYSEIEEEQSGHFIAFKYSTPNLDAIVSAQLYTPNEDATEPLIVAETTVDNVKTGIFVYRIESITQHIGLSVYRQGDLQAGAHADEAGADRRIRRNRLHHRRIRHRLARQPRRAGGHVLPHLDTVRDCGAGHSCAADGLLDLLIDQIPTRGIAAGVGHFVFRSGAAQPDGKDGNCRLPQDRRRAGGTDRLFLQSGWHQYLHDAGRAVHRTGGGDRPVAG